MKLRFLIPQNYVMSLREKESWKRVAKQGSNFRYIDGAKCQILIQMQVQIQIISKQSVAMVCYR